MTGTGTGAPAFKEWAVVCHALLEGEQILVLRKGGIREEGRHFSVPHERFWLYPTYEHQTEHDGLVKPAYAATLERVSAAGPGPSVVRVPGWAEVVAIRRTDEPAVVAALDGHHIWSHDYAEKRLKWKRREALWIVVLRAHRLDEPFDVPYLEAYGGCSSWVDFAGEVRAPAGGTPALSDETFASKLQGVLSKLPA